MSMERDIWQGTRWAFIYLTYLLCTFLPCAVTAQQGVDSASYPTGIPSITTYTPEDYHAHIQNWSFVQGENGIMYAGNTAGVLEFDGVTWRLIRLPNGSPAKSMAKSAENVIYVGGVRELGYLQPDSTGMMQFVSLVAELDTTYRDFVDIWFTYAIGNAIYFISDYYIFEWENNRFKVWEAKEKFGWASRVNGRIYIMGIGIGMMSLHNDSLKLIEAGDTFYDKAGAVTTMLPFTNGKILVAGFSNGLFLYDHKTLQPFKKDGNILLSGMAIYNSAILPNGNYIFVTLGNGCFVVSPQGEVKLWLSEKTGLPSNSIYGAYIDKEGALWLATEKGITYVDISSPLRIFNQHHGLSEGVERLIYHNDRLYISSIDGVYYLTETTSEPWQKQYNFQKIEGIEQITWYLSSHDDNLFVGNYNAMYQVYPDHKVRLLLPDNTAFIEISEVDTNRMFAGTMHGKIYALKLFNDQWQVEDSVLTVEGRIMTIVENPDGSLWLSTRYNGVYKVDFPSSNNTRSFAEEFIVTHYDTLNGLPNMSYNTVSRARGEAYFSTPSGIFRFDSVSQHFKPDSLLMSQLEVPVSGFENIVRPAQNGEMWIAVKSDFVNSVYKTEDGQVKELAALRRFPNFTVYEIEEKGDLVYFGGPAGIVSYNRNVNKNFDTPSSVSIRQVIIDNDSLIFAGHPLETQQIITLPYKFNSLRFSYALATYAKPEANQYQYYLEGFDDKWSGWSTQTQQNFTNLPQGDYVFRVRAKNVYGRVSEEASYAFAILPPWYRSWWAYFLYAFLAVGLVMGLVNWRSYRLEKENIQLQQIVDERTEQVKLQAEQLKELDEVKSRFFANISHEFRTPLTLILGEINQLQGGRKAEDPAPVYKIIKRNGYRLLKLVNQLLGLAALESGKMKLEVSETELTAFLKPITASYESLAKSKNITFDVNGPEEPIRVYLDREKMEKVVHNVISNAFKFTPKGGNISVIAGKSEMNGTRYAQVIINDSGRGMNREQLKNIFNRFYQAEHHDNIEYEGSGLGLSLSKELMALHHGTIAVESEPGKGSGFTLSLPLGKAHFTRDQISLEPPSNEVGNKTAATDNVLPLHIEEAAIDESEENTALPAEAPLVLIVEDNRDMRQLLREILEPDYQITETANGLQGLEKANELIPDLIISDVMMPEMDGLELCRQLKNDERTSHIPIVLLTAKAGKEHRIEGLEIQADDYLTKPFDADELLVLLKNRIEQRKKLRERFSKEVTLQPKDIAITSADEQFLQRAMDIVEKYMEDFNFSVEIFVEQMNMGHTQVNRKLKALTDLTPVQFIRSMRLKQAAQKISKEEDTISQIAYSVGFNNLSYFAKSFKKQFGHNPSEYKNNV